jgi:molybdopterin-guanine dinucleotide biosynthesis protein A
VLPRQVVWTQEEPAGGGPVAGIAAGLAVLQPVAEIVVLLAVDHPFADADHTERLAGALCSAQMDVDAVIGADLQGGAQPLIGAYRVAALCRAIEAAGGGSGARVRDVVARLTVGGLPIGSAALDCDTPADIARADAALRRGTGTAGTPDTRDTRD